jgi:WD40 repeat protein
LSGSLLETVQFSPDGSKIAVSFGGAIGGCGLVRVHRSTDGSLLLESDRYAASGAIDWSPDSARIIVSAGTGIGSRAPYYLTIFSVITGEMLRESRVAPSYLYADWNPVHSVVAHAGSDTSIVLTDTENWQEIRRLTGHAEEPHDVAWHPDGDYLASIDFDTIRIWDTTDGQQEAVFNINTASLYPSTVSWNVDGNLLAATIDDRIEVWDVQAQQVISSVNTGGVITGMDWHPNGTIFYTTSTVESFAPTPTALITNITALRIKHLRRGYAVEW